MDCKAHSQALLSKWVYKALLDPSTEWARLFLELSFYFTWEQRRVINRAHYSPLDTKFLGSIRSCRSMPYTTGIWQAQTTLRRHLLSPTNNRILAHWHLEDILNHLHPFAYMKKEILNGIIQTLGKLGITRAEHLWNDNKNLWHSFIVNLKRI